MEAFYKLAINDVLIGYHFTKFSDPQVLEIHLLRLTSFWEMQLTGTMTEAVDAPFHLLFTHLQLKIKRGELGRWIVLFHRTLDVLENKVDHPQIKELTDHWKERISFFETRFLSHPQMFNH
jgi:hypothetical protein